MIAGDDWKEDLVSKTLSSLAAAGVEGVALSYNGKKSKLPRWGKLAQGMKVHVEKLRWVDEPQEDDPDTQWCFSAARQHSFNMVKGHGYKWMMWIDTDDVLVESEPGAFMKMLVEADEATHGIMLRYDYAVNPENSDEVFITHFRERVFRTSHRWRWRWPVHEVVVGPPGTNILKDETESAKIRHQRLPGTGHHVRNRNRTIIAKASKKWPYISRYHYYMGLELKAEAEALDPQDPERYEVIDGAINTFRQYIMMDPEGEDAYMAQCTIAELFTQKGAYNEAIDEGLQAVKLYPAWPEAYIYLAQASMLLGDWARMHDYADIATKAPPPITPGPQEPVVQSFYPILLRGIANEELGRLNQAWSDYTKAKSIHQPPNELIDDRIENLQVRLESMNGKGLIDERKKLRGTKPEKSICFYTDPIPEAWHPETAKETGAGGAETCIIELARRFRADGWRVAVFGTPGQHRGVSEDGTEWWRSDEWYGAEPFTVTVSSRSPQLIESEINSKGKFLWLHDVNRGGNLTSRRASLFTATLCLTEWHRRHTSALYGIDPDRILVVPNGVDEGMYPLNEMNSSQEPKFIFSSSADRGLDVLLAMWPTFLKNWEKPELHVFYGWNMIDKIIDMDRAAGAYSPMAIFKASILQQISELGGEEGGIFMHGRVSKKELAGWQKKSTLWTYPTSFMETFCITALEMQMAGAIPVTSGLAALWETVACRDLLVQGWPNNVTYQNEWLKLVDKVMLGKQEQFDEYRAKGRVHAEKFSWDNVYKKWNEVFYVTGSIDLERAKQVLVPA